MMTFALWPWWWRSRNSRDKAANAKNAVECNGDLRHSGPPRNTLGHVSSPWDAEGHPQSQRSTMRRPGSPRVTLKGPGPRGVTLGRLGGHPESQ